MEHESFVPGMTTARMVQALRTPDVVRASLPGWQPDAGEAPDGGAEGRLRLRVGGSTITYRGTVTVSGEGPGFTVEAVGTEVRGGAGVTANAEVTVVTAVQPEAGVTVVWRGEARAEGRLTTYEPAAVEAAVRRLLDRFCAELAANAPAADTRDEGEPADGPQDVPEDARGDDASQDAAGQAPADAAGQARDDADGEPEPDVVDDLGEPGPPADDLEDFELVEVEVEVPESAAALDDLVPPAEAAHARRTMIGRSAEEVDHAPPRGRYAPVPAPDSSSAAATLRWAAPVAAALVASAVVVGRVLRRRG
ncbi:SRPBCC domain-containing protein [Actinacidiphila bryophytorum]|uniref:Carbon monoxide dehydrogenase subunit G n=1 Tax=Actinacidiphila bryophytorum TaxID=1436133 RepID=A0A9W4MIZ1_9ACTN|nr:SRPBCC domain-containing protein [Actinacidiphila bryophytorum]MBM9435982.1 carbon monoxide dehydrogenase subunit G [Actinacidiphila bryophytorum]MBN6541455.1 carbon monoxide dehydrogenase subunit G [Actinacidiphila bryophytorum]CAG7649260.1 Carbon monoxide dehydrogenase subunit G [Actinacidiphila bryophytorum]